MSDDEWLMLAWVAWVASMGWMGVLVVRTYRGGRW